MSEEIKIGNNVFRVGEIIHLPEYLNELFKVEKICPKTLKVSHPVWNWISKSTGSGFEKWEWGWSKEPDYIRFSQLENRSLANKIELDNIIFSGKTRQPPRPAGF